MLSPRSILTLHIVASLAQALVLERQVPVVSVNPISFVPASPSNTTIVPGTVTVGTTTTVPPSTPIGFPTTVVFTPSGLASPSTGTLVIVGLSIHGVPTPAVPSMPQPTSESGSSSKGAIAGGVLGALAVIVAALAAFVWFRRRSPRHWRNRTIGRWQTVDDKDVADTGIRSIYVGEPVYGPHDAKRPVPNPLPPLYIRDRHTAADPFGDISSPASPRSHARRESSGQFDIELQPTSPNK